MTRILNRQSAMIRICVTAAAAMSMLAAGTTTVRADPLGSEMTYQGRLQSAGSPLTGVVDLQFKLFDAETLGAQVGATQTVSNIDVVDGVFTVQIDFGTDAFAGDARWLEIAVRGGEAGGNPACTPDAGDCFSPNGTPGCNSAFCCNTICASDPFCCDTEWDQVCADAAGSMCAGGFTTLSPRQPVTVAPAAWHAMRPWAPTSERGFAVNLPTNDGEINGVGIGSGTFLPEARLHVRTGAFFPSEAVRIEDFFARSQLRIATPESQGRATLQAWNGQTNAAGPLSLNIAGGNVGIGTSSPTSKLDVAGSFESDGFKLNGNGAGVGRVLTSDASGVGTWQTPASSPWAQSGSDIAYTVGNVGIGTSTPDNPLHVVGSDAGTVGVMTVHNQNPDGLSGAYFNDADGTRTGWMGFVNSGSTSIAGPGTMQIAAVGLQQSSITLDPMSGRAVVTGSLNSSGDIDSDANVNAEGNVSAAGFIAPDYGSSTNATYLFGTGVENTGFSSPNPGEIAFIAAGTEAMRIDSFGKVGIGTSNPLTKLHVVGNARVTGTLRVEGLNNIGDFRNMQYNDTNGVIGWDTSSARYKENIQPLEDEFERILDIEPQTYTRIGGDPNRWEIGYLAEDMDELGLTRLVEYDQQGRPDGVNYEKALLFLKEVVRDQRAQQAEQEKTITELNERLQKLEAVVEALTSE